LNAYANKLKQEGNNNICSQPTGTDKNGTNSNTPTNN
jgi:hypothetical protein